LTIDDLVIDDLSIHRLFAKSSIAKIVNRQNRQSPNRQS